MEAAKVQDTQSASLKPWRADVHVPVHGQTSCAAQAVEVYAYSAVLFYSGFQLTTHIKQDNLLYSVNWVQMFTLIQKHPHRLTQKNV